MSERAEGEKYTWWKKFIHEFFLLLDLALDLCYLIFFWNDSKGPPPLFFFFLKTLEYMVD